MSADPICPFPLQRSPRCSRAKDGGGGGGGGAAWFLRERGGGGKDGQDKGLLLKTEHVGLITYRYCNTYIYIYIYVHMYNQ